MPIRTQPIAPSPSHRRPATISTKQQSQGRIEMSDMTPNPPQTLGDVARLQAQQRGGDIAYTFEGRATTFADFDRHTNRIANGLIAAGLKPGTRIAYLGKNSDYYFETLIGAA